ncbi:MAG: nuclear transport factor 2 family protein [Mycobacteriaceae bacterium]
MKRKFTVLLLPLATMIGIITGCSKSTTESVTVQNKNLVTAFYEQAFVQKDIAGAANTYIGDIYLQHNPQVADGKEAFIKALSPYVSTPGLQVSIARIIAENDLVVVHSATRIGDASETAVADIFRVADNKIVEHWDVQQNIPASTASGRPMT